MVSTKVLFVLLAVASGVVVAGGLAGFGVRRGAIDSFQETLDTMHDDETLEDAAYSSLGTKVTDLENTMKGAETLVGFTGLVGGGVIALVVLLILALKK